MKCMAKETREFPTAVLLSITTGKLLCQPFSLMHEAAEFVLGSPVFTHHFASSEMNEILRQNVLKQHPDLLPNLADDVTSENWQEKTKALVGRLGETRTITKGNGVGRMGITEGVPKDKRVIGVKLPKKPSAPESE